MSPGTRERRLSEVARVVSQPEGIVSTRWDDVEKVSLKLGVTYDEWQKGAGRLILAERADGTLASTVDGVGMSLPRQVGKTYLLTGLIFSLCILRPGTLVIWSAQHSKTHEETFLSMQGFCDRQKVAPYVERVYTGSGDEEVRFANGSRILFGARERGFGRGIPGVDVLVFDEAQILSDRALDAMLATMNTSRFGLAFYIGTPPRPEDNSESFTTMRTRAMEGDLPDGVWIECGADKDADPEDRRQWAKANPSYPERTPAQSFLRLKRKLLPDSFMREGLGVWQPTSVSGVIPMVAWNAREDLESLPEGEMALGVEVGPDLTSASVALAGRRSDGRWHIELDERADGTAWLEPHLVALLEDNPQVRGVVVDVVGPISALLEEYPGGWRFKASRVRATPVKVAELGRGCASLLDGIVVDQVRHIGQSELTVPASQAGKRALADTGMWVWSRKAASSDITPIQAATLALIGAQGKTKRPTASTGVVTTKSPRRAVIL